VLDGNIEQQTSSICWPPSSASSLSKVMSLSSCISAPAEALSREADEQSWHQMHRAVNANRETSHGRLDG